MKKKELNEDVRKMNEVILQMIDKLTGYGMNLLGEATFESPWVSESLFDSMTRIRNIITDAYWAKDYREAKQASQIANASVIIDEVSFASYSIGEDVDSEDKVFKSTDGLSINVVDKKIKSIEF